MITFIICLSLLIGSYFVYGKYLDKIAGVSASGKVPSTELNDGVDYIPMPLWKTFMIQLLNIAGLGPIYGAVLGAVYGPVAFLWITFGTIFIGAVHDYFSGVISMKRNGESYPEIIGHYLGLPIKQTLRVVSLVLMLLVGVVFMIGPAGILSKMIGGDASLWIWIILFYYFLATMLPIDKIIGRIYPIFGAALIIMALLVIWDIFLSEASIPNLTFETLRNMRPDAKDFPLVPTMFITIACGAISGFHATQSPLMARCARSQQEARPIFFGAMITESIIALIWAAVAMAFFHGPEALFEALRANNQDPAAIINIITNESLGKAGAILVVLGIVAAPITTGDTAFRTSRLIIADFLKLEQRSIRKRLYISIPIFIIAYTASVLPFDVAWRYTGWLNQVLAATTLWAITVYIAVKRKPFILSLIPACFMTYMVTLYMFHSNQLLGLPYQFSCIITAVLSLIPLIIFLLWILKRRHFINPRKYRTRNSK